MKVAVLGAGSWGTALTIEMARSGHDVLLWGRDPEVAARIEADGRHPRRLTGYPIPASVRVGSDLGEAFDYADTLLVAVPCASLRPLLGLSPATPGRGLRIVSTGKGNRARHAQAHVRDPARALSRGRGRGALGPDVRRGCRQRGSHGRRDRVERRDVPPTALQASLSSPTLRLYRSDDVVGVELAGALKNVVAIAAGIVAGLGFGPNTLAALVTRGLAEIGRIVRSQGGQDRTVQGLAGIGDLMLTCTGSQSRNRFVGEQVGRGRALADVLVEMPEVAEGARTCLAVPRLAGAAGVDAPIAEAVVQVLYEGVPAREAVERLMTRALRPE